MRIISSTCHTLKQLVSHVHRSNLYFLYGESLCREPRWYQYSASHILRCTVNFRFWMVSSFLQKTGALFFSQEKGASFFEKMGTHALIYFNIEIWLWDTPECVPNTSMCMFCHIWRCSYTVQLKYQAVIFFIIIWLHLYSKHGRSPFLMRKSARSIEKIVDLLELWFCCIVARH